MKTSFKILFLSIAFAGAVSCSSVKDISYFQDSTPESEVQIPSPRTIAIDVADKLSIVVASKDPVLAAIFNLPLVTYSAAAGNNNTGFAATNNQILTYTVDAAGNIDFPVLGTLHVQGLKREEVATLIKDEIVGKNYIKDAVVVVDFANLYVSVMGEVARPGRYQLTKDKVTILDALSQAGDLTITGQRTNVKVYRVKDGKQICHVVNLTSAKEVFESPVYYLQQDDVIYVEPNLVRARQSTVNGNNLLSTSFWVSVGSLLTSVASLVVTSLRLR